MASLQDIRRRIKSVTNTKQITSAMNMVATSRLRRAKGMAENNRPYAEKVIEVVQEIAANVGGAFKHPLLEKHPDGKRLIFVITSDKGLAGAYTSNASKLARSLVRDKDRDELIVVGRKGASHFRYHGYNVVKRYVGFSERPRVPDAQEIAKELIARYETGEISEVIMVYTKFISAINCEPQEEKLLPFEAKEQEAKEGLKAEYIYEPDAETVLSGILPQYIFTAVYAGLLQSAASESSSRMNAMSNATDNAEDLIGKLNLHYNKVRQAGITTELNEVVAGAEGQK